jgi:hypothetical protein
MRTRIGIGEPTIAASLQRFAVPLSDIDSGRSTVLALVAAAAAIVSRMCRAWRACCDGACALTGHAYDRDELAYIRFAQERSGGEMIREKALTSYLAGAVIVWIGILVATAVVVDDADQFMQLLPILGGGAFWFIVIVPTLFQHGSERRNDP